MHMMSVSCSSHASFLSFPCLAFVRIFMTTSPAAFSAFSTTAMSVFVRRMSAMKNISSRQGPFGVSRGTRRSAASAICVVPRSSNSGILNLLCGEMMNVRRPPSADSDFAISLIRRYPVASAPVHEMPLSERSRYTRLLFFSSASSSGGISTDMSLYVHVKVLIAPFCSASSGRPAPTFQSWMALSTTLKPACRASLTSSIHVFSVASVEIRIDFGSSEA